MTTIQKTPSMPERGGELAKSYSPATSEDQVRARWDAANAFHADPELPGEPFCILIPPPNVTAALHLGHAFNNTLQDVLTRYHRMRGFKTLWMPGTDHAGIATQTVVEKRLMLQGKRRTDFTRDEFVAKVQEWKDEYEATIISQLKAMGCSCDFDRTRFTMDEVCAKAVREAFFRLFKDGLIYRGKRLVNWDPVTQTALADDEVEMEEVQGHMWYLRYPVVKDHDGKAEGLPSLGFTEIDYVTVATTRPETMLGDTAVAINPKDPRAAALVGKFVRLPIVNRVIPIIADDYVVMPVQYGGDPADAKASIATGFLKVTPAHDPNDYEIGQRHNLPLINVMAPDASISDKHGWPPEDISDAAKQFLGLSREEARKRIVQWFKDHDLLEDVKPYTHSIGHSYRSHVPIEPYLSDQWYVKVTDDRLKGAALRAMAVEQFDSTSTSPARRASEGDGELRFFPARYAKTFQHWHENLRDWCISRQLWWGHRIPVWRIVLSAAHHGFDSDDQYFAAVQNDLRDYLRLCAVRDVAIQRSPTFAIDRSLYLCCLDPAKDAAVAYLQYRQTLTSETPARQATRKSEDFQQQFGAKPFQLAGSLAAKLATVELDHDVLDTWFSSALWPLSTMGWPDPEAFLNDIPEGSALLNTFNPSSTLCTAREIITLWVSRMVMFNRYFRDGKLPFRHVYIHAVIQDGHGQKMSKSLGNGVDPRDIIHTHGSDAMRFVLAQIATTTQDVRLPVDMLCPHCTQTFHPKEITSPAGYRVAAPEQTCPNCSRKMISGYGAASGVANPTEQMPLARNTSSKFDLGRNFANKLWNATRFALSNLSKAEGLRKAEGLPSLGFTELTLVDKWIIARLHRTLHLVEDAIADYQFHAYADAMYDLVWRDFCDWYLEAIKPTVKSNPAQQQVLRTVLNAILRLLHPIMPFVTETLWPHVNSSGEAGIDGIELPPNDLLATAAWPDIACRIEDKAAVATFERVQALVEAIRSIKTERNAQKKRARLYAPADVVALIEPAGGVVESLAGLDAIEPTPDRRPDSGVIPLAFEGRELLLAGLVEAVDVAAEKSRLEKLIAEKERAAAGFRSRLENPGYVSKAPPEKVEETRRMLAQAEADLTAARGALESLA